MLCHDVTTCHRESLNGYVEKRNASNHHQLPFTVFQPYTLGFQHAAWLCISNQIVTVIYCIHTN
jgi:hypothetical protein